MRTLFRSDTEVGRWELDELFERYISWLEECGEVRQAYQRWLHAKRAESRLAYAEYVAALDHEEHAARAYAVAHGRITKLRCDYVEGENDADDR